MVFLFFLLPGGGNTANITALRDGVGDPVAMICLWVCLGIRAGAEVILGFCGVGAAGGVACLETGVMIGVTFCFTIGLCLVAVLILGVILGDVFVFCVVFLQFKLILYLEL